jgi:hypothetical protein
MPPRKKARRPTRKVSRNPDPSRRRVAAKPTVPPPASPITAFVPTPKYKKWRAVILALGFLIFAAPLSYPLFGSHLSFAGFMPEKHQFFLNFLSLLQNGRDDMVRNLLAPNIRDSDSQKLDDLTQALQKAGPVTACHLINVSWDGDSTALVYFLDFENASAAVDFKIHASVDGNYLVDTFSLHPADVTFRQICQFRLSNRSFFEYLFLLAAFALFMANSAVLARCLFTPLKRKWLWVIFILVGIGSLTMDWLPDPIFHFSVFSFGFPVASLSKNPLTDPWQVELTFPLGMLVFWWMVWTLQKEKK